MIGGKYRESPKFYLETQSLCQKITQNIFTSHILDICTVIVTLIKRVGDQAV